MATATLLLKKQNRTVFILFIALCFLGRTGGAGEMTQRRIMAGLDLFPSFLAADQDIEQKRTPDGTLLLMLIYPGMKEAAEKLARQVGQGTHSPDGGMFLELVYPEMKEDAEKLAGQLTGAGRIRGLPVRVETLSDEAFSRYAGPAPAGVFLAYHIPDIDPIIKYCRARGILLISPMDGDMARGAMGGVYIRDRILPHVNMAAVKAAGVRLKPFFLKVAKKHAQGASD